MPVKKAAPLHRDLFVLPAFVLAVAARVAFAVALPAADFPFHRYLAPAFEFAKGRWFSAASADQLPGAPLLFALAMPFVGENWAALALLQHALGLATWVLVVLSARDSGGARAARWTAWLFTAQLLLPYQERFLLSETAAHFFLAAALYAAIILRENPGAGRGRFAFGGFLAGMAALTRGELLVLGPILTAALALPRKGRPLGRVAVYATAWAVAVGGWTLHNRLSGCAGFNALGASTLIDPALSLVRYDLPSNPAVKKLLREEAAACGSEYDCIAHLRTARRLQELDGPGPEALYRAQFAIGEVAREAILTQPLRYAALIWPNVRRGAAPIDWVGNEALVGGSAITASRARGGWRETFWSVLERGPQSFGWAPLLLSLLAPLGLLLARPKSAWGAGAAASVAVAVVCVVSLSGMSARLQSSVYPPLCLLGGLSAAYMSDALRFR